MMTYVGEGFAGTFSVASSMDSPEALQKVLTVLLMFVSLWVGGLTLADGGVSDAQAAQPEVQQPAPQTTGR